MAVSYYLGFLFFCMSASLFIPAYYCSPLPKSLSTSSFDEAFTRLYGEQNVIVLQNDGKSVQISLDDHSGGSGFVSRDAYNYGFFSASIKLPSNPYTAGVVVTFYTSNDGVYRTNIHDELDFEFLGHTSSGDWVLQTNLYGNGSTERGREERYKLPFNPSENFHKYSILWTEKTTAFYVDDVPIRVIKKVAAAMAGDYPLKPMSLYATTWDGSGWATEGGRFKANYTYSPFVSRYSNFVLKGCSVNQSGQQLLERWCDNVLTQEDTNNMKKFRANYMIYTHCMDKKRYPIPLPECMDD